MESACLREGSSCAAGKSGALVTGYNSRVSQRPLAANQLGLLLERGRTEDWPPRTWLASMKLCWAGGRKGASVAAVNDWRRWLAGRSCGGSCRKLLGDLIRWRPSRLVVAMYSIQMTSSAFGGVPSTAL